MSPRIARAKSASIQRPPYVIRLQTVWRLYGDGMETHRFSVPADGDQDDLITLEGWTPTHGSLTLNPATALVLDGLQILHVSGPQARYGSLATRRVPAGQAVVWDKCRCSINAKFLFE
jgi:hypothetical protein